jgi:hypothetical protein
MFLTASGVNPNGFQQPATGERKVLGRKADVADIKSATDFSSTA